MTDKMQVVSLAQIHPFHADENVSRSGDLFKDQKDQNNLANQLLNGWRPQLGLAGLYILTEEQSAKAAEELMREWSDMKAVTQEIDIKVGESVTHLSASDRLRAWEDVHTKNGKLIGVKYGVVYGFRRIVTIKHLVNAVLLKIGRPFLSEIPASIKEYDNELDRIIDCVSENTQKTAGARMLSDADTVKASQKMFETQCSEADFRRVWKVGTAQKLFALCRVSARFPEIKLVDAVINGDVPFGPLDKEEMRKLGKEEGITVDDVNKYITTPKKNAMKIASKTDITKLAEQFPVQLVTFTAKAILEADCARVNKLLKVKDELNEAISAVLTANNITL